MKKDNIVLINSIRCSLVEAAKSCFGESELRHLETLIRITVEFDVFLESNDILFNKRAEGLTGNNDYDFGIYRQDPKLMYSIETIFSGIDSFCSVIAAYKILVGAVEGRINFEALSVQLFKYRFMHLFKEFCDETVFEKKCRMLLDLFKMQIVFAGILYG